MEVWKKEFIEHLKEGDFFKVYANDSGYTVKAISTFEDSVLVETETKDFLGKKTDVVFVVTNEEIPPIRIVDRVIGFNDSDSVVEKVLQYSISKNGIIEWVDAPNCKDED